MPKNRRQSDVIASMIAELQNSTISSNPPPKTTKHAEISTEHDEISQKNDIETPGTVTINDLPVEILEEIIIRVPGKYTTGRASRTVKGIMMMNGDPHKLGKMARVCKTWRDIAQAIMFRKGGPFLAGAITHVLQDVPFEEGKRLCQYVREIVIWEPNHLIPTNLVPYLFSQLQQLHFDTSNRYLMDQLSWLGKNCNLLFIGRQAFAPGKTNRLIDKLVQLDRQLDESCKFAVDVIGTPSRCQKQAFMRLITELPHRIQTKCLGHWAAEVDPQIMNLIQVDELEIDFENALIKFEDLPTIFDTKKVVTFRGLLEMWEMIGDFGFLLLKHRLFENTNMRDLDLTRVYVDDYEFASYRPEFQNLNELLEQDTDVPHIAHLPQPEEVYYDDQAEIEMEEDETGQMPVFRRDDLSKIFDMKKLVRLNLTGQRCIDNLFLKKLGNAGLNELKDLTLSDCDLIRDYGIAQLLFQCDVSERPKQTVQMAPGLSVSFPILPLLFPNVAKPNLPKLQNLDLNGIEDLYDDTLIVVADYIHQREVQRGSYFSCLSMIGTRITLSGLVTFARQKGPMPVQLYCQDLIESIPEKDDRVMIVEWCRKKGVVDVEYPELPPGWEHKYDDEDMYDDDEDIYDDGYYDDDDYDEHDDNPVNPFNPYFHQHAFYDPYGGYEDDEGTDEDSWEDIDDVD